MSFSSFKQAATWVVVAGISMGMSPAVLSHADHDHADGLAQLVQAKHRSANNIARNDSRNPVATLEFFELAEDSVVVEIWPGSGWYSEIIAPFVKAKGKLYAAHFDSNSKVGYFTRSLKAYQGKLQQYPWQYESVTLGAFFPPKKLNTIKGVADRVLTFRNVHNWMKAGYAEQAFAEFYIMLKPGGLLGVVEHRAKPGTDLAAMIKSGYVSQDRVISLAEQAGFKLLGKSEINANAKDSGDHPRGVWTLPPNLALGEQDRQKYVAIGESDRMTLKFIKPKLP